VFLIIDILFLPIQKGTRDIKEIGNVSIT